jgi:hypothetical protein
MCVVVLMGLCFLKINDQKKTLKVEKFNFAITYLQAALKCMWKSRVRHYTF